MVFKLQKRIYRASERGDVKAVRRLQRTLMRSWYARLLTVRRVTQDNKGKKTAGVDGKKTYSPAQRLQLTKELRLGSKAKPTRRVWIPKPGREEKRPLGIPTMYDRALQGLVKLALEPEWEAKFEPNSYGFRPGRSCHDAIEQIYTAINQKAKYVLDADIAGCFDNINHEALLKKLNTPPTIRRQIKAWLKAGVIDWSGYANRPKGYSATSQGTPQGGVISPLLANIALHGMENRIKQFADTLPTRGGFGKRDNRKSLTLVRYADDFVILHEDIAVVQRCQDIISDWLKGMGLELKPSKTRISHTLTFYKGNVGFDFLGFNIRQYSTKKRSARNTNGKNLGFKTIIKPSPKSIKTHYLRVASTIDDHSSAPQEALITRLNPVIRGWANYYSTVCSSEIYSNLDHLMWNKLWAWAKYRCPDTGRKKIVSKYWRTIGGDHWVFATGDDKNPLILQKYAKVEIQRHIKVKGNASPYDGNQVYWSTRKGSNPEMPTTVARLLKAQKGKCAYCGLYFREEDEIEVDHIAPKSKGGSNKRHNLQALHKHCHDSKTREDGSLDRSTHDKWAI
jgi:RNA-directed DNA polymerase